MIGRLRRRLGMSDVQLWTFLPNVDDYIGTLGERISVYYCVDEWSKFTYVDGDRTAAAEQRLLRKVDLVFATAQSLVDARLPINPHTYLARHGVQREQFAQAMDSRTEVPADIADLPRPVIGFYGTIQDWIDQDLICHMARQHPEWSIVMIGGIFTDVSRLKQFPNIHLLGRREHAQLPAYCKGFEVGIIPYVLHERILHVNPIKLREYLSAGLPVVSTAFPEAQLYPQWCATTSTPRQFTAAVESSLKMIRQICANSAAPPCVPKPGSKKSRCSANTSPTLCSASRLPEVRDERAANHLLALRCAGAVHVRRLSADGVGPGAAARPVSG